MVASREVLEECDLNDLGFSGQWFTWERGRLTENNIQERLDRGIANPIWWRYFPSYFMSHLTHSFLDHCPLLMYTLGCQSGKVRRKEFPFFI